MTTTARRAAYDILLRIIRDRSYADILIDHELTRGTLKGPDRGLLTELVYGTLRRQGTLDYIIGQLSSTPPERLDRPVLLLLRLGLYQMLYLDRIPVSAAVNETVNLAKALAPRASGLINAILRRADRERDTVAWPDRSKDPAGYIAAVHSHPRWLVESWIGQLGDTDAEELARVMSEPPPLTLRVNTLITSRDELASQLARAGIDSTPTSCAPHGLRINTHVSIAALPGFKEGMFTVQDEASQLAALILAPEPGDSILDACAAPGGKATYLAQLMENRGRVIAGDISGKKLRLVSDTAARLGIDIITTTPFDAAAPPADLAEKAPDRIIIDAPCSGLGVIRRNPEAKWLKKKGDLEELSRTQKRIIGATASLLAPGGTLVYSTCSTAREENEAVIEDFLSQNQDFMLEDLNLLFPELKELFTAEGCFRGWPHRHGMDGFFAARLRRAR